VQIITVHDTIPPTITCPLEIIVMTLNNVPACPGGLAQFLALGGTAHDNCDASLIYQCLDGPLIGTPCGGMIIRTHTVTDDCTNSASCTQIIRISHQEPPIITCPPNTTVQCLGDVPACPSNLTGFLAAGGTVNTPNVTYHCSDGPLVGGLCGGTITRTHCVTDDCTNSVYCAQIIRIHDTVPPVITCPANLTVQCLADVPPCPTSLATFRATGGAASDNCDPNLSYSCKDSSLMGDSCGGTIWRIHTVTDDCNNSAMCEQIITIRDTISPSIACPPNFSVPSLAAVPPCPTSLAAFLALGGTASDNCDSSLTYSCSDGPMMGGLCAGTITRTHCVTDDCTNTACCVQIITILKTNQVTVALNCPTNLLAPLSLQSNSLICAVDQDNAPVSFYKATLNNMPPGYLVGNGMYNAWCVDYAGGLTTNAIYKPAFLYLSYGPLPPPHQNPNWDRINYVLNHKQGNSFDIQAALWHFIGGPIPSFDIRFVPLSNFALSMIADATAHGAGFLPQPGQLSAVILDLGVDVQTNIIEIVCPREIERCVGSDFTVCATATGTGPFTYNWTKDGMPILGAHSECLSLTGLTTNDTGTYCVEVMGACTTTASSCLAIKVNDCPPLPPPRLLALQIMPAGDLEISVKGELGRSYFIEASVDLVKWRRIAKVVNVDGTLRFTDPARSSTSFYRAVMEP
jgi:hypothetical protein